MGEEEKKPEEKKMEEKKPEAEKKEKKEEKPSEGPKKEEKKTGDSKDSKDSKEAPPPLPPQEIVLKVYMHCEGCARKVRRSLKGFEGVEDVVTDCKTHTVVVKGEKADPLKVQERVQMKSHRQVELLTPIPKPPAEDDKKKEEKEKPKPEEKKEEPPPVITVLLKVQMHCEACAQGMRKRIMRMKGVESAEPDLKSSQVTVKGVFEPPKLVEYVYRKTKKQAVIVKQEPEKKEDKGKGDAKDGKEEKKGGEDGDKDKKGQEESKDKKEGREEAKAVTEEETKLVANPFYYQPPPFASYQQMEYAQTYTPQYPYAPSYAPQYGHQMFSDENPNACSVM